MLTAPVDAPLPAKARIAEILFERYGLPALHVATATPTAMYAYGRTTGLVVDVGETATRVVPIIDGFSVKEAIRRYVTPFLFVVVVVLLFLG
jgi:actin-related protein